MDVGYHARPSCAHQTRRKGRPYTLALTKTEALFEREAATRRARQANLDWLTGPP